MKAKKITGDKETAIYFEKQLQDKRDRLEIQRARLSSEALFYCDNKKNGYKDSICTEQCEMCKLIKGK